MAPGSNIVCTIEVGTVKTDVAGCTNVASMVEVPTSVYGWATADTTVTLELCVIVTLPGIVCVDG